MAAQENTTNPSRSDDNVMAAVATIPLIGLFMYLGMKDAGDLVKYYGKQSIGLLVLSIINMVIVLIPLIGWIFGFVIFVVIIIVWLLLVVNAWQGKKYSVPIYSDLINQVMK